jgi:hypothetical protein
MNERIRELAAEAWQYANNNSHDGDDTHGWLYRDKFAELIVKECAEIADNADATREKWQSIGKFVREHFGVEQ